MAQDQVQQAMVGGGPAFSARGSAANQAVTSQALTKVTLDTEEYDTANCFASSRFTPNVPGYYQLNGVVRVSGNAGTIVNAFTELWKNGGAEVRGVELTFSSNSAFVQCSVSGVVYLNGTTDYVELYGFVNGTNTSFNNATPNKAGSCFLQGYLVRAA